MRPQAISITFTIHLKQTQLHTCNNKMPASVRLSGNVSFMLSSDRDVKSRKMWLGKVGRLSLSSLFQSVQDCIANDTASTAFDRAELRHDTSKRLRLESVSQVRVDNYALKNSPVEEVSYRSSVLLLLLIVPGSRSNRTI